MADILDGKKIAKDIKDELLYTVTDLRKQGKQIGTLVTIQVGDNKASIKYVNNKIKACEYIGINNSFYHLSEDTSKEELLQLINELNKDDNVKGILVQLPLPKHIDEDSIINAIDPNKDVDCFHPINVGALTIGKQDTFLPCTPAGIIELLKRSNIEIEGRHCVIVGRSNIVGKPLASLMLRENATVTIAHSKSKDLLSICRSADILIVAIGKARFINNKYIRPGAVVIDVGINVDPVTNKLCGDVDFDSAEPIASAITPVPGGVGPMTIAMLMSNYVKTIK